jgi:hypothetical protein
MSQEYQGNVILSMAPPCPVRPESVKKLEGVKLLAMDTDGVAQIHCSTSEWRETMSIIDRTSKFAVVELVERADVRTAAAFLEVLVQAVPYRIHIVLTDNGIQFADLPKTGKANISLSWISLRPSLSRPRYGTDAPSPSIPVPMVGSSAWIEADAFWIQP